MPDCGLLDKKSIKCPGIRRFLWSPKDNIISYWVPEQGEAPARVTLMKLPQRNDLKIKRKFIRLKILLNKIGTRYKRESYFVILETENRTK